MVHSPGMDHYLILHHIYCRKVRATLPLLLFTFCASGIFNWRSRMTYCLGKNCSVGLLCVSFVHCTVVSPILVMMMARWIQQCENSRTNQKRVCPCPVNKIHCGSGSNDHSTLPLCNNPCEVGLKRQYVLPTT